jgi:gamma-glutamyltranspeptidase / glutathione hydrolase
VIRRVVVCPEPLAAEAGAEIFRRGGSAVDAALATAYAQCVVSPVMASIAGTGGMNLFHAPTGRHVVIDFLGRAGSLCTPDMYVGRPSAEQQRGYRSILVPSFVRGTYAAFEQFGSGRVSWATILEPAIRYAEDGFAQYPYLHQYWRAEDPVQQTRERVDGFEMVTTTPASAAIFTVGDRVHFMSERIVQPDLGRTLRRIAEVGPDDFYTGEIGRQIAADFETHGAAVTSADLAACQPEIGPPLFGSYRGLTVATDRPPNIGLLLVTLLNVLEGFDVAALRDDEVGYWDLFARALYEVLQERRAFMTDPASERLPYERLFTREHADLVRARVRGRATVGPDAATESPGTTHVSTFDEDGSAVSFTHSIGIGSGVVTPGLGFMHNNGMQAFDPVPGRPNSIGPGKQAISGGGPAIVLQDGGVRYVIGSPHGSRKTSSMGHALVSLIDFGRSPAASVASPRIHCEADPRELLVDTYWPLGLPIQRGLAALGYRIREDLYGGRVCLVAVDPTTGQPSGASDPRGGGGLLEL